MKFFKYGGAYLIIYAGCVMGQIAMYIDGKFDILKTVLLLGLYTLLVSVGIIFKRKKQKIIDEDFKL